MMFCVDDCCSMPMHILIADMIESQGGMYYISNPDPKQAWSVLLPRHTTKIYSKQGGHKERKAFL